MIKIVIVNQQDKVIATEDRKTAIRNGLIHRIARIFVFNRRGELFLQQRNDKVAFPNLWDQSVGGHVDAGETYEEAALREAKEELNLTDLYLKEIATYFTELKDPEGNTLRRFNRLFTGTTSQQPRWDPEEVQAGRWISMGKLREWIRRNPDDFTGEGGFLDALRIYQEKAGV